MAQPQVTKSSDDTSSGDSTLNVKTNTRTVPTVGAALLKELRALDPLQKAINGRRDKKNAAGNRGYSIGLRFHPYSYRALYDLIETNPYHQACINAKVSATVGLGFQSEADLKRLRAKNLGIPLKELPTKEEEIPKIDRILNPLCAVSFQDTLVPAIFDYWTVGWGALEVVRKGTSGTGPITGLHHLSARDLLVYVEDRRAIDWHFQTLYEEEGAGVAFARFGDLADFKKRIGKQGFAASVTAGLGGGIRLTNLKEGKLTEVIVFRNPSGRDRFYGGVDYLGATTALELFKMVVQNEFDYHYNRGVPEFLLALMGANLTPSDRDKLETALGNHVGPGNQHKTSLLTLTNPDAKVQVEKLAMDQKGDGSRYAINSEACGSQVVSAHGVPPLLAGIHIAGKMAAANETVQALQLFHLLKIRPAQHVIEQALHSTLANPQYNGGLDLSVEDCTLTTLHDEIDFGNADTVARMRQSPQEAEAEGRSIEDGLKD